ncbi:hypothetical protein ALC57_05712 [Trachymyrmex cornetzi]|uniref:Uncharacterized protein n=1 Tax=Trachymyrmex cornetzi TaxID=471704 RepID=A0A151JA30_9HYME|nr:hypothetical protein ALC57_05712 [Trachymyrmex cornetzi]
MYLALHHPSDILDLSAEQLQYISKVVLLRVYGDYIDYVWRSNDLTDRHVADKVLADKALRRVTARDSALSERAAAAAVWAAMKIKSKIGMGMKLKKTMRKSTTKKIVKKRILPTAKRGGELPFLPMLGALGSLIGGASSVAKAVNDNKAARRQLEELQRHDRAMEQGRGLYLAPHKYGRGHDVAVKKKKRRDDKNALGCNYQRAIGCARETYACTVF